MTLNRRGFIAASVVTSVAAPSVVYATPGQTSFDVYRNGTRIGEHSVVVARDRHQTIVDISIEMNVKLAFISLYKYQHRNREIWDDGGLVRFDSVTNDNGEEFIVSAERVGDRIRIAGHEGELAVALDNVPTTYWHRQFMKTDRWIDTQYGRIVESSVSNLGQSQITAMNRLIEADHYVLAGDLDLELWYQGQQWVKLRFKASDDSIIEYGLTAAPAAIREARAASQNAG